jgi:hypothetical protein
MKKFTLYAGLLFAMTAAIATVWAAGARPVKHDSQPAKAASSVDELAERLKSLEAQLKRRGVAPPVARMAYPEHAEEVPTSQATPPAPNGDHDAEAPLTSDEAEYRQVVLVEAETKLVSDKMATEPLDPTWSKQASDQIAARYRGGDFAEMNVAADCRSTLCKITFSNADIGKATDVMRKMANDAPWASPSFYHLDKQTGEGYAYLSRENFELPMVDPKTLTY